MSTKPFAFAMVPLPDSAEGDPAVVVVARRSGMRRVRVHAKRVARALGVARPLVCAFYSSAPVAVLSGDRVEVLP